MNNLKASYYFLILWSLLLPLHFTMYSQEINKDSLKNIWKQTSISDSVRLNALNDLAWDGYLFSHPDSTIYYAQLGIEFSESKGLKRQQGLLLNSVAVGYWVKGDYDKSLAFQKESLKIRVALGDEKGINASLNNLGALYHIKGNYLAAIRNFSKVMECAQKAGNEKLIADSYSNLGVVFMDLQQHDRANDYFLKSLDLRKKLQDNRGIATSLNNLAHILMFQDKYEKAIEMYKEVLGQYESFNDKYGIALALESLGDAYIEQDQIVEAKEVYHKSLSIRTDLGDQQGIASALSALASIFVEHKNYDLAQNYAERALRIAKQINALKEIRNASEVLVKVYKFRKDYKKSLTMYELYIRSNDSLLHEKNQGEIIRQEFHFEYNSKRWSDSLTFVKQQELEQLSQQRALKKEADRRYLIYIVMSLFIVLGVIGLRDLRRKMKINALLMLQNEEKTAMLKEIHHRVKNNLQVVNSLLKMQSRSIDDDKIFEVFQKAQNRVLSMALLHEKMYKTTDINTINIAEHFSLIIEDLIQAYATERNIKLALQMEGVSFGMKTMVPLGLIVNELVISVLRNGFMNQDEGLLTVVIEREDKDTYVLVIQDDSESVDQSEDIMEVEQELLAIFTAQLRGKITTLKDRGIGYQLRFFDIN